MKILLSLATILVSASVLDAQYSAAPQLTITNPAPENFQLTWQSKNLQTYFLEGIPDLQS